MILKSVSFLKTCLPSVIRPVLRSISFSFPLLDDKKEEREAFKQEMSRKYPGCRIIYGKMDYEPVDVNTSILYLKSAEYRETYKDKPIWYFYRRNFKGFRPYSKMRKNCVRLGQLCSKSACPICRDNHLVIHYRHTELLNQFIDKETGLPFPNSTLNFCLKQYEQFIFHLEIAHQVGLMQKSVPIRLYDYNEYYSDLPNEIIERSIPYRTSGDLLPNAFRMFLKGKSEEIVRPKVPNRYAMEEREYLQKRADKLSKLKANKMKK